MAEIRPNDWLRTTDGWVRVTKIEDTGRCDTVYNLRVADYHTYFVGAEDWGFAVWAHNAYEATASKTGVVQVWDKTGGRRGQTPLLSTTAGELEVAAHRAANRGEVVLGDLRKSLAAHPDLKHVEIRPAASELKALRPGSPGWDEAIESIRNPTKSHGTDFRVETYRDAETLLTQAKGGMPFFEQGKTTGWRTYQRGYESHGVEIETTSSTPWNNLKHIKWRDMTGAGGIRMADGHIYFGG